MNASDIVTILIFLIVPLSIMAVAPFLLSKLFGGRFRPFIITAIFIICVILLSLFIYYGSNFSSFIPRSSLIAFSLVMFVGLSGAYLKKIIDGIQLRSEDILLDLGPIQNKAGLLAGAGNLFFCLFLGVQFFIGDGVELSFLTLAAVNGLLSIVNVTSSLSKVYLTKQGVTLFFGTIKWEQMQGYNWGGRTGKKVRLIINNGGFSFYIPVELQAQVEAIFEGQLERRVRDSKFRRPFVDWSYLK